MFEVTELHTRFSPKTDESNQSKKKSGDGSENFSCVDLHQNILQGAHINRNGMLRSSRHLGEDKILNSPAVKC